MGDMTRVLASLREKVEELEAEVDEGSDMTTATLGLVATGLACLAVGAVTWWCRRKRRAVRPVDLEMGEGDRGGDSGVGKSGDELGTGLANPGALVGGVPVKKEDEDDDGALGGTKKVLFITLSLDFVLSLNTKMGFFL